MVTRNSTYLCLLSDLPPDTGQAGSLCSEGRTPGAAQTITSEGKTHGFVRINQAYLTHLSEVSPLANIYLLMGLPGLRLGGSGTGTEDTPYLPGTHTQTNYNTLCYR